ncbi:hypothetical protein PDE_00630 [Penicillium oxalicum 114-2]|uniref:Uncharacterized protein n=1 Tax=Penicillium oxalicum (strain 114-2 / CGMCC 5302) TaxID=933388 RepID=S7ZAI1_PENO1|nr:hypothetical protein PDE_00630 [Penicillium oxalicum 114-2]
MKSFAHPVVSVHPSFGRGSRMSSRHVECKIVTTDEDGHQLEYYVFLCQEIILVYISITFNCSRQYLALFVQSRSQLRRAKAQAKLPLTDKQILQRLGLRPYRKLRTPSPGMNSNFEKFGILAPHYGNFTAFTHFHGAGFSKVAFIIHLELNRYGMAPRTI